MPGEYSRRTFEDGEVIFSQNDRAGEAYLIQSGSVRIHHDQNGTSQEIDTIGKGTIFGEMGVISDMNRMASAISVGETLLLCCQRGELQRRLDDLDKDKRDALRFLIVYCQSLLPFEMMENRPDDEEATSRDKIAFYLIRDAIKPGELDGLDVFLGSLYETLIGYAKRRLPPNLESKYDNLNAGS